MKTLLVTTTIAVAMMGTSAYAQMRGGDRFERAEYGIHDPGVLYRFANGRRQLALEPPPPPGSGLCNTVQIAAGNCVYYRR